MVGKTIKKWWPVFVLPTLAAFIIGFLWPFIWGIYLSFCKFTTVQDVTFVGLANYSKLLLDKTFSHSFWLTVISVSYTHLVCIRDSFTPEEALEDIEYARAAIERRLPQIGARQSPFNTSVVKGLSLIHISRFWDRGLE